MLGAGALGGCEAGAPPPPAPGVMLPRQHLVSAGVQPCTSGSERECAITLGVHAGVLSCHHGVQVCEQGTWSDCVGTLVRERELEPSNGPGGSRLLAYGAPEECADNPCDPLCQGFIETPPEPLVATPSGSNFDWQAGSSGDPNAKVSAASVEPCSSGSDCQANQRCTNVTTDSTCGHSKCQSGDALVAACDDCVERICGSNPECCQRGWACAHDVCTTGVKLDVTCDDDNPAGSCVADVCSVRPSCCSTTWDATCVSQAQNLCGVDCGSCAVGEFSSADGSSCYYRQTANQSWSAARAACQSRGAGWDLVTIDSSTENALVDSQISSGTWLGYSRNGGSWSWSGGTSSFTRWYPGEPNGSGSCARILTDGRWYDTNCNWTYDSMCEGPGPGTAASVSWTQACVDAVRTVCDASCDTATPPSETGRCSPWQPGETDAACPSAPDLALGVPCDSGVVPVCNHGGAEAPAGVTVSYYAAGSAEYPACTPDPGSVKGVCAPTTAPIPPGECVNVTCPTAGASGLATDDLLVVNAAAAIGECSCLDNWTLYGEGVACGAPTCAGTSSEASFKPVRMFIVVDRSYSMVCHPPGYPSTCFGPGPGCTCTADRWNGAVDALTTFFQSASSAGVGVAMDLFPLNAGSGAGDGCASGAVSLPSPTPYTNSACAPTACANPLVPLGYLAEAGAPSDTQEQALVSALTTAPVSPPSTTSASTPSLPALEGALDWAVAEQLAKPNETFVVVFVTDGEPTSCLMSGDNFGNTPNTNAELIELAAAAHASYGVRTYTLGMEGSNIGVLDQIAAAGGTGESFVVGGSNAAAISSAFASALTAISGSSASCSLPFNATEHSDPESAVVTYTSGTSGSTLARHADVSSCGDGWYFDDNANPGEVILCPSTCETVQADSAASVKVDVPCAEELEAALFSQVYRASCGDAQYPLWQFLTYDTTIADGGQVEFRVRSADTEPELASAAWLDARVATQSEPDCRPGTGISGCPVDLVDLLGGDASDPFLELGITVVPGAETPSADRWQITFTCPFNQ